MTIQLSFEQFHDANPGVYEMFKKIAFALAAKGKTRLSARYICETIREECSMSVPNNYSSRYARLFNADNPTRADLFQLNKIITP